MKKIMKNKFLFASLIAAFVFSAGYSFGVPVFGIGFNLNADGGVNVAANDGLGAITFGDGDSGIHESSDDVIRLQTGGGERFSFSQGGLEGLVGGAGRIGNVAGSATVPVHTFNNDTNTGAGTRGADCVTLVAGGVEGASVCEASSIAALHIPEITTPTAITNYGAIYTKSDNKIYFQDGAGAEHEITLTD